MGTLKDWLDVLHVDVALSSNEEIKEACELIVRVQSMTGAEVDTLRKAFEEGPIESGDCPSKSARDQLVMDGLMCQIVVKGDQGYNACTYKGLSAYRLMKAGA